MSKRRRPGSSRPGSSEEELPPPPRPSQRLRIEWPPPPLQGQQTGLLPNTFRPITPPVAPSSPMNLMDLEQPPPYRVHRKPSSHSVSSLSSVGSSPPNTSPDYDGDIEDDDDDPVLRQSFKRTMKFGSTGNKKKTSRKKKISKKTSDKKKKRDKKKPRKSMGGKRRRKGKKTKKKGYCYR